MLMGSKKEKHFNRMIKNTFAKYVGVNKACFKLMIFTVFQLFHTQIKQKFINQSSPAF